MFNRLNIMVVDDEIVNLILVEELLKQDNYTEYRLFSDPLKALDYAKINHVDALITDYKMPNMDGIELLRLVKVLYPSLVSIMVTIENDKEMMVEALKNGATEFLIKPIFPLTFKLRLKNILEVKSALKITNDFNKILKLEVAQAVKALRESEFEVLEVLSKTAEYKDSETASHVARVSHYSKLIAKNIGLSLEEQNIIFYSAPLHDIGKVGIADAVLLKPGKLTTQEFETMKEHSRIGHTIISNRNNMYLQAGDKIAYSHHEKYNGTGYPEGLAGENIPLFARIVAVADVFDALTSVRVYKKAWNFDDAKNYIINERGGHFDPKIVDAFLKSIEEVKNIYVKFAEN